LPRACERVLQLSLKIDLRDGANTLPSLDLEIRRRTATLDSWGQ